MRDPRDIIVSIRAFNERHAKRLFGRPLVDDDSEHLRHLVLGMALRFKEFRQPLPVPALQLRYEDFVTDMAAHARRLGSLLEVELDASAVASNSDVMAGTDGETFADVHWPLAGRAFDIGSFLYRAPPGASPARLWLCLIQLHKFTSHWTCGSATASHGSCFGVYHRAIAVISH